MRVMLWFDVGIVRYTTMRTWIDYATSLWFDVGIVRYTTPFVRFEHHDSCGLM